MAKYALVLAALASSAAAFAPVSVSNANTGLNAFANGLVGGESVEPMPFRPGPDKTAKNFDPDPFLCVILCLFPSSAPQSGSPGFVNPN